MSNSRDRSARQAAAEQAARLKAQQDSQQRTTRIIVLTILGAAVAALVGVVWFILSQGQSTTSFESSGDQTPSLATNNDGFTIGASGVIGEENAGKPVVSVYYDYLCPACGLFEETNNADLEELVEDGVITLEYHPVAILDGAAAGTLYSTQSANAAATVLEYAPEKFIAFHNALYANQPSEGVKFDAAKFLLATANEVGIPADVSAKFSEGLYAKWVNDATDRASADGLQGTPTIRIDGVDLPQSVNWAEPGTLRTYLEGL